MVVKNYYLLKLTKAFESFSLVTFQKFKKFFLFSELNPFSNSRYNSHCIPFRYRKRDK